MQIAVRYILGLSRFGQAAFHPPYVLIHVAALERVDLLRFGGVLLGSAHPS
jgi:hypothetical protein